MISDQVSDVASTCFGDDGNDSDSDHNSSKSKTVHSMVEKKRRDKMAQYVSELSTLIPMCGAMPRKLDKITVLRMAVQHMKAVKGSKVTPSSENSQSAAFSSENLMRSILENSDCFLFVVACDRGKFLYVSESVSNFINCQHTELIGQSIFEVLYSKDVETVKSQLKAFDATAREVFIDAKTMEPVNPGVVPKEELHISSSGAARSFFCRMKTRLQPEIVLKTEPDVPYDQTKKKRPVHSYVNLYCKGFLKTWASSKVSGGDATITDPSEASSNLACLVAIARKCPRLTQHYLDSIGNVNMEPTQFYARLDFDYQFTFVDPEVTYVTGLLPQEVLGNVIFEYFLEEDSSQVKELLEMTTKTSEKLVSSVLGMKTVDCSHICVRVVFSSFTNPLTSELQHILLHVTAVPSYTPSTPPEVPILTAKRMSRDGSVSSAYGNSVPAESAVIGSESDDDANNEASNAIIMSILGPDGGLGGKLEDTALPWVVGNLTHS